MHVFLFVAFVVVFVVVCLFVCLLNKDKPVESKLATVYINSLAAIGTYVMNPK